MADIAREAKRAFEKGNFPICSSNQNIIYVSNGGMCIGREIRGDSLHNVFQIL